MVLDRVSDGLLAVGGGFGGSLGSKTSYILSVSRAMLRNSLPEMFDKITAFQLCCRLCRNVDIF